MTTTPPTLEPLYRYVNMATDLQTYRGYDTQMRKLADRIQSEGRPIDTEQKQQWQEQLAGLQQAKQNFPEEMQQKYGVQTIQALGIQMRAMEPGIER